ncbi:Piwi domain-containing protein [Okeania sp. SIO2B3]|uniref:Piwi domain-containing protein n=1 Tax=Okeania sp. SIO2B3 TaxID=2607784 RepID=UPI0013BFEE02|nr:Piwi domain-containing protein [Okeania sp. SIO2B3]NET46363.1 stem cell self-renewal protein Piwi [Okeania sp. SIO2B3]
MTLAKKMQYQAPASSPTRYLSEIFPLEVDKLNVQCFRLNDKIERQVGNQFAWRFCQKFSDIENLRDIVVIWEKGDFWVLAKSNQSMPTSQQYKQVLKETQEDLKEDIGDRFLSIQWVRNPEINASVKAQLAVRILKFNGAFSAETIKSENQVKVKREVIFGAEIFEVEGVEVPAIFLTPKTYFSFGEDLAYFFENHPFRQNPEKLLIGLKVRDIEKNSSATIVKLVGTIGERSKEILEKATGSTSKEKLREAPDEQPVVAVKFGKNPKEFHYAMAALRPCVTSETAHLFKVEYGDLLKATKISYTERQKFLISSKQKAEESLSIYGFKVRNKCINSASDESLFFDSELKLKETKLLFGNGFIGKRDKVVTGLSQGGVYSRHKEYSDRSRAIRIAVLKVGNFKVKKSLLDEVQKHLKKYKFESIISKITSIPVNSASLAEDRSKVEKAVNELIEIPADIVLTILPQSDRNADNNEEGSFYSFISSRLLRRGLASQIIYEKTLANSNNYKNILNQVIPGILAKLGNLPFILAEPLEIADYFIGIDISRTPKKRQTGSLNVCASVRLYGKQGEFIGYQLEDALTEGETIEKRTLERFLPAAKLSRKTVLIYRDGRFCGDEVKHLRERAKTIHSKFILVECIKSGIPRLLNFQNPNITAPTKGLALRLSSHEVILVTTHVAENMGLAQPLRLKVIPDDEQKISLENLVEATLKLTLLHHGSLKEPRLPVPIYGSDRIAYRRLQGISPGALNGDRQFWL